MIDHTTRAHALLSASSAHRWLACPPSALLEAQEPEVTSVVAKEGTLAHEIAEIYLRFALGEYTVDKRDSELKRYSREDLYSVDMEEYAKDYVEYILSKRQGADYDIAVEQRLDFSKYVPNGFGTGDCLLIQNGVVSIIDFKYGHHFVDAYQNKQMLLYALGAIEKYDVMYTFDTVEMCIYQPRIHNISESRLSVDELMDWATNTLQPIAQLASEGGGKTCAGKHCLYCKVRTKCKTLATYNLETIKKDFIDTQGNPRFRFLSQADKAMILDRAKMIKTWLKDMETACIQEILDGGQIEGYKVVEGRSNRKYGDFASIVDLLEKQGYGNEIYKPRELLTLTGLQRIIGTKGMKCLTDAGLIIKPDGAPSIVPISDKRPEYTNVIKNTFAKENNNDKSDFKECKN